MAIHRFLCISIALSLAPAFALAEGRPAGDGGSGEAKEVKPSLHPGTLGKIEGILDYCTGVSGQDAFKGKASAVVGQASEKELAAARDAPEYRDSYDEIKAQLAEVPKDQAQKACSEYAKGG